MMVEHVEVTQADRDAAVEISWAFYTSDKLDRMKDGRIDGHPIIQAFARHRLATHPVMAHSYHDLFNAIAAATSVYGGGTGVNVSVSEFRRALAASASPTPEP